MTKSQLVLGRAAILAHRRAIGSLDERLPAGGASLRRAAWAGLQDSMPRAALLSIHARVDGTTPTAWEDPALVQVWGPRYSAYVVAAADLAVFTLGRLPDQPKARRVAWRRTQALVTVAPWRALTATQRQAIEMEAASMPLPGLNGPMEVRWAAEPGARSR